MKLDRGVAEAVADDLDVHAGAEQVARRGCGGGRAGGSPARRPTARAGGTPGRRSSGRSGSPRSPVNTRSLAVAVTPRARCCSRWWLRWRCSVSTVDGVEVDDAAAAAGLRDADHLDAVDDGGRPGSRSSCCAARSRSDQRSATSSPRRMPVSARRRNIAALRLPSIDSRKRDSSPGVQTVISGARARAVGQRRGGRQAGDVAGHDAGALGVVEQLVERGVDVVHAAHRQATTAATARRAAGRRTARRGRWPGAPAAAMLPSRGST